MRVSKQWLQDWVSLEASSDAIATSLTMAGLEVDAVEPVASDFTGVVIGQVVSCEQHPNADRLRCCRVDVGTEVIDIVCGGSNVRTHQKVPVAQVGAQLSPDFKIKRSKLRGEPSCGMICSSKELGLGDDGSGGIMELSDDAPVGQCIREYLQLDDVIFDVDLTPNRGDCLSMKGIAREVAIFEDKKVSCLSESQIVPTIDKAVSVVIEEQSACPRYVGRVIRQVPQGKTPLWMGECLRRCGLRLIHPVVDILNYVMLELGQPMHAFDLSKLKGGVCVRRAKEKESIQLLDEQTVELTSADLVIADEQQALALAGVMGGHASAVNDQTADIFLESAYFEPIGIAKTARRFGLQTDSSYRFARHVDIALQEEALERTTSLILDLLGGQAGPLTVQEHAEHLPKSAPIRLRFSRIERVLGLAIERELVVNYLVALGMDVSEVDDGWDVVAPTFRSDIHLEIDLIEEVARLFRFDKVPMHKQAVTLDFPIMPQNAVPVSQIKRCLVDQGYHETIHYSFIDQELAGHFSNNNDLMILENPLSKDMSTMRPSLWPGLLMTLRYNQHRQCHRQALFEIGTCFYQSKGALIQENRLALLLSGARYPEQWGESQRQVDFYDIKGQVEALLDHSNSSGDWQWQVAELDVLHPGQSAALYRGDEQVGWLGALHPSLAQKLDIDVPAFLFEANMAFLQTSTVTTAQAVSKFPSIRRDLSFIFDQNTVSSDIIEIINQHGGPYLDNVHIFDVYQGDGCEIGKKSIAIGLTFQAASRTLVDEDINQVIDIIMKALQHTLNATLRV